MLVSILQSYSKNQKGKANAMNARLSFLCNEKYMKKPEIKSDPKTSSVYKVQPS